MSSKTKIVVVHMKELIYTGIFILLGIVLIVLLISMFTPEKSGPMPKTEVKKAGKQGKKITFKQFMMWFLAIIMVVSMVLPALVGFIY